MKRIILIGLALTSTNLWGQVPAEQTSEQLLCVPFVEYAADLVTYLERAEETGVVVSGNDSMRRVADATLRCAETATRLWSRAVAVAGLVAAERRFEAGISTTIDVSAARVAVEKANYCVAAFSHIARQAENYERRFEVGLADARDVAPFLTELEVLMPECGR